MIMPQCFQQKISTLSAVFIPFFKTSLHFTDRITRAGSQSSAAPSGAGFADLGHDNRNHFYDGSRAGAIGAISQAHLPHMGAVLRCRSASLLVRTASCPNMLAVGVSRCNAGVQGQISTAERGIPVGSLCGSFFFGLGWKAELYYFPFTNSRDVFLQKECSLDDDDAREHLRKIATGHDALTEAVDLFSDVCCLQVSYFCGTF